MTRKRGSRPRKYKKAIKIERPIIDMKKEIQKEVDSRKYDKNMKDKCCLCGRFIGKSLENYLERGNYCERCNYECYKDVKKKQKKQIEKCTGDCTSCRNYNCLSNLNIIK